jgi:lexA repressor
MRHKSTELTDTIKAFVEKYYKNYSHSPSTTKIADALGIARGTAYKYLVAMNENGMISYDGQQISNEQTEKVQTEFTSVALLGTVSCGVATLEEEYAEECISLRVSMFGKGTFFLLRAKGESMIDAELLRVIWYLSESNRKLGMAILLLP